MRELTDQERSYILIDALSQALKDAGTTRFVRGQSEPSGNKASALYNYKDKYIDVFNLANKTPDDVSKNLRHETVHNITDVIKGSNTERLAQEVSNGRTLNLEEVDPQYLESFIKGTISPYRESYNQPSKEDLISMRQREYLIRSLTNMGRIIREYAAKRGTDPYNTPVSDVYLGDVESALNTYSYPESYTGLPQRNDYRIEESLAYTNQGSNSYQSWLNLMRDLGLDSKSLNILDPDKVDYEK